MTSRREFCPHGHCLSDDNLVVSCLRRGLRVCKTCVNARDRARRKKLVFSDGRTAEEVAIQCKRGHKKSPENRTMTGHCKQCANARAKEWKRKKRRELGIQERASRPTKTTCKHGHPLHVVKCSKWGTKKKCKTCENIISENARRAKGIAPLIRRDAAWRRTQRVKHQMAREARKKQTFVEYVDPIRLYERDAGICGICKQSVHVNAFEVDHIRPISKGGEHSYQNTQISHPSCNRRKQAIIPYTRLLEDTGKPNHAIVGNGENSSCQLNARAVNARHGT